MRISDWSSDVCSSDLLVPIEPDRPQDLWALRHAWRAQTGTDPGTADGWNVTERAARLTPVQPLTVHGPGRGHPALVAQGIEHRFPKPCVSGSNPDRTSVVKGKSVSVRVDHGGRRIIKKKKQQRKKNKKEQY